MLNVNGKKGGAHEDLDFDNTIEQRHHMPSQTYGNKEGKGGTITMEIVDHKFTASCDSKPGS